VKADKTLDCVGLYCPMPIVQTSLKIKEMKTGEVLEILADDKGIKQDMPAWCQTTGNECLGVEEAGREIKVYVKKTQKL
jgi:tRNA 2-thiouridine synthesizing protein A